PPHTRDARRRPRAARADPPVAGARVRPVRVHHRARPGLHPHPRAVSRRISRRALLGGTAAAAGLRALGRPGPAAEAGGTAPAELPRYVLALYKSSELDNDVQGRRAKSATRNEVHGWAQ